MARLAKTSSARQEQAEGGQGAAVEAVASRPQAQCREGAMYREGAGARRCYASFRGGTLFWLVVKRGLWHVGVWRGCE